MEKEKLYILKIGGRLVEQEDLLEAILTDFASKESAKILVHGGAKKATELSLKLGIEPNIVDGRRITDTATLEVVQMVYAGLFNKRIVAKLQALHCNAIGLTGADGNSIQSVKRPVKAIDYGWVGDIKNVNQEGISHLLQHQFTPVFCALTHDKKGQMLNTNADTIASKIAAAMTTNFEVELCYCFEKKGVLNNPEDEQSYLSNLSYNQYQQLLQEGVISDGMMPKLQTAFEALRAGAAKVIIGNKAAIKQNSGTTLML